MEPRLNRVMVLRLAKYLRVLQQLKALGFVKVFSNNLGDAIGVTPAVVRKDFSLINIPGNKRGGYNIDTLITDITTLLGHEEDHAVVVVGCGRIGGALMDYREFEREGIRVVAGFDTEPERVQARSGIPVHHISQLSEVVRELKIHVGIIAVPDNQAAAVFDQMLEAGIRGILNFTSVDLKSGRRCGPDNCPIQCVVQNVNIGLEIDNLFYLINTRDPGQTIPISEIKARHARAAGAG